MRYFGWELSNLRSDTSEGHPYRLEIIQSSQAKGSEGEEGIYWTSGLPEP